jgi:hypothetical protein
MPHPRMRLMTKETICMTSGSRSMTLYIVEILMAVLRTWSSSFVFIYGNGAWLCIRCATLSTLVMETLKPVMNELNAKKVYGNKKIEKVDCINNVSKRMGTALHQFVEKTPAVKLPDKGRFTKDMVSKLHI